MATIPPQAYSSSYAPRLRQYNNSLFAPATLPLSSGPTGTRTSKRGTQVNYSEDVYDDDDFDTDTPGRRPTGLRSLRRDDSTAAAAGGEKEGLALGTEIEEPVVMQPIHREWMVRKPAKPATFQQINTQAQLPLTLIPIRIDLDVPAHHQPEPFPPLRLNDPNLLALPPFRRPDPSPAYKIKDIFLWNLHEALITPDEFATKLVQDLDLPNAQALTMSISDQIRRQSEEYAGIALHPLFSNALAQSRPANYAANGMTNGIATAEATNVGTPITNGPSTPNPQSQSQSLLDIDPRNANGARTPNVTASASLLPQSDTNNTTTSEPDHLNPDDTYRCIITLNVNLSNKLYTDKFEWSLLHPPGFAEDFARITCADLGLGGEWVNAISHGIYEATIRLKKEACESGGMVSGFGQFGELENLAANLEAGAGWRYDSENAAADWEPTLEILSKEEIEKKEGDRERQIRRQRREAARFSSNTGVTMPSQNDSMNNNYFENPENSETPMGRGERSKKKRRFRSLSPLRNGTPGRGTPDVGAVVGTGAGSGYGGGAGGLTDWERQTWRCSHCLIWGSAVWAVRDGPAGPRTLCHVCGFLYERDKQMPSWCLGLHQFDVPVGRM